MKRFSVIVAVAMLATACASTPEPFDCSQGIESFSGVVKVKQRIPDCYIVVLKSADPGAEPLRRPTPRPSRSPSAPATSGC